MNWLLRQLKKTEPAGFFIRATRPGKAETTYQALKDLRDSPELLESDTSNTAATEIPKVGSEMKERDEETVLEK